MRVLIIKLTSMGDLMHAFPALSDAVENNPNIQFDWVVDESFAEVPAWHPAVNKIITTAHRRWKKSLIEYWKQGEFQQFYRDLNADTYDVIIDLQSNLKSAFVSWLRRSPVSGYDKHTCREKPAHWAYATHYHVPLGQHAIERQRDLLSKILDYPRPTSAPRYGADVSRCQLPHVEHVDFLSPYVVFVHNASWPTKLWPEQSWQHLIKLVVERGFHVLLPCGSDAEYQRAQNIAALSEKAIALPKMCLNDMSAIMSNAQAAVCSDTGLAHMAAVLSTPAITLYAVTDTRLIGTVGDKQQHIVAGAVVGNTMTNSDSKERLNASMADISVDTVWNELQPLLSDGDS